MGNPDPVQSESFRATQAKPFGSRPLSRGQVTFRLLPEHYDLISSHASKGVFARQVITALFEGRHDEAIALVKALQEAYIEQKLSSVEKRLDQIDSDLDH